MLFEPWLGWMIGFVQVRFWQHFNSHVTTPAFLCCQWQADNSTPRGDGGRARTMDHQRRDIHISSSSCSTCWSTYIDVLFFSVRLKKYNWRLFPPFVFTHIVHVLDTFSCGQFLVRGPYVWQPWINVNEGYANDIIKTLFFYQRWWS